MPYYQMSCTTGCLLHACDTANARDLGPTMYTPFPRGFGGSCYASGFELADDLKSRLFPIDLTPRNGTDIDGPSVVFHRSNIPRFIAAGNIN
jgi:hypothetical protein